MVVVSKEVECVVMTIFLEVVTVGTFWSKHVHNYKLLTSGYSNWRNTTILLKSCEQYENNRYGQRQIEVYIILYIKKYVNVYKQFLGHLKIYFTFEFTISWEHSEFLNEKCISLLKISHSRVIFISFNENLIKKINFN